MTIVGSALAAAAVAALVMALQPTSGVGRRLERVAPTRSRSRWRWAPDADRRAAGLGLSREAFLVLRLASAAAGALTAALVGLVVPIGPLLVALAAYAGHLAPSLAVARRAARRRREADAATTLLIERTEALVSAGRPPETALALLIARPTGSALLDATLRRVADAYALGAPLFRTLEAHASDASLATCAALARELERARDLGTGSLSVIRERRIALRRAERARRLESASQVEGKLMLVLVLCYLPALMLLVVIPLFVGLLEGLGV